MIQLYHQIILYVLEKNLLEWIDNKIIKIYGQSKEEKLQYDINRETAKISAFSSGNISKHEYLLGEKLLPSNQKQLIEQVKFSYSPLWKTNKNNGSLRKQTGWCFKMFRISEEQLL